MAEIRRYMQADLVFGVVGAIIAAMLLRDIQQIQNPRAIIFPSALLWCLLVASLAIAIQSILVKVIAPSEETSARITDLFVPALALVLGGVSLSLVGFYLTAPVMIFVFHAIHAHRSGQGATSRITVRRGLVLAGIATLSMYLVFDVLIGLPAPSGTLI